MSEEKLTVAELMARAAKDGRSTDAPRRRRRRSIEDGGVSVAELTGSIPAVKEKPAESRHSSVPIDAPAEREVVEAPKPEPAEEVEVASVEGDVDKQETPERPAPSNEETMVLRIVDEKDPISLTTGAFPVVPAVAAKPAPVVRAEKDADAETAVQADFAQVEVDNTETTQMAVVEDVEEPEQENKLSVLAIIMMAIVGVVLGVVVFLGFEMLWERLNKWIVAVLAVGVTLGMVGIIHALRTSRDGFSMVLAGIVGLVMTFGPLAIVM